MWLTSGDMNGDGRDDMVLSSTQGTYCRDSATGAFNKLHTPAQQLATGDMNNDGKDDLMGMWQAPPGVWIRYSADGSWENIINLDALSISAGKMR